MIKCIAISLMLILFVGCPQPEGTVESNSDETTAPAETEPDRDPSESMADSASAKPNEPASVENASSPAPANHPTLEELTSLLSLEIESDEVQSLVTKFGLGQSQKFDEGSFTAKDQAFTLMFRGNRIDNVIFRASPWPEEEQIGLSILTRCRATF